MKRRDVFNLGLIVACVVVSVQLLRPLNLSFFLGLILAVLIGAAIGVLVSLASRHVWGRRPERR